MAAPFVSASENVLTGVVLLGFALGWALLAVLSVRFSDQPQRWAAAPAAFMAVAGLVSLSGSAAVQAAFSWVWPPVLFGLVVWMFLRVRRQMRSRIGRWLLYPVLAVLMIAAVGGGYQTVRESLDARAYPPPGQLIDVGGHRLHLYCTGSGSPTVVLEPGGGASSSDFGWITPAVARDTRVCVYDRAGRGWSDATDGPQDGAHIAADLHTLLQRADVPGPYVLAGHSFGGLYVQSFAAQFPDQVAGLVLLDSTAPKPGPAQPTNTDPLQRHRSRRRLIGRVRSPRSRTAAQPDLLHNSSATLPGRGPRQLLHRRAPRQLYRGVWRGEHVDAAGVGPDQPQRQAADRPHRRRGNHRRSMAIQAGPHGHAVDQQSPPTRERHPRFAPRRRSRRCRSQPGNPRRRHRRPHLPVRLPRADAISKVLHHRRVVLEHPGRYDVRLQRKPMFFDVTRRFANRETSVPAAECRRRRVVRSTLGVVWS